MTDIKLERGMWVLVADGEKALFLRNEGDTAYPDLKVVRLMNDPDQAKRNGGGVRPDPRQDETVLVESGEPEAGWQRFGKERFAEEIADRLYKMAHNGDFDRIVLVAPPFVLGEMRKKFHKTVLARVAGEVAKTLTNRPIWDIEKLLAGEWHAA